MGNLLSKKQEPKSRITEQDEAVLVRVVQAGGGLDFYCSN
jgi:hypothetical protein